MKVTFKDAMTFLNNADTPVTIETGSKKITVLAKQIKLAIFKLDRKQFGFIFKNNLCHTDANDKEDFEQWNKKTKQLLGRELEPCFLEVTA